MKKILFSSVMSYWPAIEKLFNSGTYLLRKKLISKTLQKTLIVYKKINNRGFYNKINRMYFVRLKLGLS